MFKPPVIFKKALAQGARAYPERGAKAAAQAAAIDKIIPGMICRAKPFVPALNAITAFARALALIAARMGNTASLGDKAPDFVSEATEIAAAWVSTKPASPAPAIMPASPSLALNAATATSIAAKVVERATPAKMLKARPFSLCTVVSCDAIKSYGRKLVTA